MEALSIKFKALGDPTRLQILKLLPTAPRCDHACNVSELAETLKISQPAVSHHLRILKHAGIVRCEKMCRDVFYWVDQSVLDEAISELHDLIVIQNNASEAK